MQKSRFRAAGLLAGGAVVGAVLAGAIAANAASTPSPSTPSSSQAAPNQAAPDQQAGPDQDGDGRGPAGGGHAGETALTGSDLAKARAAALKAVPGGTVVRIETDSGDAAYEAHMTKSDGTRVTVKFDKSFTVTGVEDGMGK